MFDQAFRILEYPELRSLIQRSAQTPMGQARVAALEPHSNLADLNRDLSALAECVSLRKRGVAWTFQEVTDPAETINLLRVEGVGLSAGAILQLRVLLEQAMSARASILAERDAAPVLWGLVERLPSDLNRVVARIGNKILPNGEIDDRASVELARIRHDITKLRSRITRTLENLMRKSEEAIQDELVTIRNDRFVIPVKADHRGRVSGVAHGYSSSGATAFVEPLETIEANNDLQALHEAELREITRILFTLSEELRAYLPAVENAAQAVGTLDFINAKAIFHHKFNCVIPEIGGGNSGVERELFELIDARHPLLEENLKQSGNTVVPVSFSLDNEHDSIVISGANAGGKTVVLKTAGLLALMSLSGLSVPARGARIPFYRSILADIGDHQSLAANLSTFTSHVANISRMIEQCEDPALVLLDEVGTGTDPEEGSTLGVAIVDHFRRTCAAHVMATTHYSGLKVYAANEDGVLNASVEFDEKTLRPTYRLIVGVAGSSSGLEIARRFGIPGSVIDVALQSVKDSSRQAAEYLRRIKRESEEVESLRRALEEERAATAEKFAAVDKQATKREVERQAEFEKQLKNNVSDFENKASALLAKIEDRAARLKVEREIQERAGEFKREARRASSGVATAGRTVTPPAGSTAGDVMASRGIKVVRDGEVVSPEADHENIYHPISDRPIAVGDRVKLKSFGSIGIVDEIKGDDVEVRVKSLRMREKLANLELMELKPAPRSKHDKFERLRQPKTAELNVRTENGRSELNVIGQTTEQAIDAVDKFLDEASIANLSHVRIIHGHGTGALRRAIGEMLKNHPHVARFSAAPQNQGGTGATVVELHQ